MSLPSSTTLTARLTQPEIESLTRSSPEVTTLSAGTHVVTVSVSDSDGQQDADKIVITVLTTSDTLTCKEAEYNDEKDEFMIEVKTSDKSGGRTMSASMDVGEKILKRNVINRRYYEASMGV